MVTEILSQPGWGGHSYALRWIEESLKGSLTEGSGGRSAGPSPNPPNPLRPWVLVESSPSLHFAVPALSPALRQAISSGRLLFVRTCEELAPEAVNLLLEGGLCEGVLLHGLDRFSRASPAGVWGRRWQLSARKGGTQLLWVHEREASALIGFDLRLRWTAPQRFEIRKGHGYFEGTRVKHGTDSTAA
jgi:hypothetical protein